MQAIHPDRPILSADYDFEPENDASPRRRGWLLLGLGAAALALAGFGAVAAYGWLQYGRGEAANGPAPVVRADLRPVKERPESPGGMQVPDQDKEIYGTLGPGRVAGAPPPPARVERLLPPPETPLPRPVPAPPEVRPPASAAPAPAPISASPPPAPTPVQPTAPPAVAAPPPAPAALPSVAPAAGPTAAAPAAPAASAAKPAPTAEAAARPLPPGAFRIQLAALTSSEDATRAWERLRRAHPDVLGALTPAIVKVDLPGKGTFYRLQAGPLPDRDHAASACAKIATARAGCLVVPPA